jgi:hypothetical protein
MYLSQFWRSLPLTITGFYLAYRITKEPDETFIFDGFWLFALAIITALLLRWSLRQDLALYKKNQSGKSFLPSLAGIIFPLLAYFSLRNDNRTVLYAIFDRGFEGASITLREDGTYQLVNTRELGKKYFYGKYQLQDSLIWLDKSNLDGVIESNRLAIRTRKQLDKAGNDTLLYQTDATGKVMDNTIVFSLLEDNRKNK